MQSILFFNGSVLLVLGALLGFPYWLTLSRNRNSAPAWRVAHSAITAGAVGILVIAAGFGLLRLSPAGELVLVLGASVSGFGFAIASTLSAITGHRGLVQGGKAANQIVLVFNVIGALGSVLAGPLLVYGAFLGMMGR